MRHLYRFLADIRGFFMATNKTKTKTKKRQTKGSTQRRRSERKSDVIVQEERTRVLPRRRVVAVKQEPVTLSRAMGEAAVVEPAAESPAITETTVVKRRRV
jgi:phosphatidate phosphatase PAH1